MNLWKPVEKHFHDVIGHQWQSLVRSAFLHIPWDSSNVGAGPDPSSPCKGSSSETHYMLCFCVSNTRQFLPKKGHENEAIVSILENQLDSTKNSSYFSLSIRHWDCTANGWELRGLNLQFNIQPRLAILSKRSTIYITGFLGEVFESAAADNYKWPEVSRRITRRKTWYWGWEPLKLL